MKRLISILVCLAMALTFIPSVMAKAAGGNIYYVSPSGSDMNSGSSAENAWNTFAHAASAARAGDTVIFKDGTYNETALTIFSQSGTESAPIVFKAENKRGAIINYVAQSSNANSKLQINSGKEYIEIRDFVFTQETPSDSNTSDIMIRVRDSAHCKIVGNKISDVFEEGVKLSNAHDVLVEDNIITGTNHEGIDSVNSSDCVIRGNHIIDCGRTGVMIKGNSRNFLVYNNLVKNTTVEMANGGYAFTVGGATGIMSGTTLVDYETGFEAYNCVFYNNVVYGGNDKKIKTAFAYIGAKDCYCLNNTIIGVVNGFSFGNNGGEANGWGWNAGNVNPVIKNNIISNASKAFSKAEEPENLISDYNLYNQVADAASIPTELNGAAGEPKFISAALNWSITSSSAAAKAGTALPDEVDGFAGYEELEGVTEGKKLTIEKIDFYGKTRKTPYDIGACNREKVKTVELLREDFEKGTVGNNIIGWNGWVNKKTDTPNDSYFKIAKESNTSSNLVGNITRTNSNSSSVQFLPSKHINEGTSAGENVSVKFRLRTDDARTRAMVVSVYDTSNKGASVTVYMNDSSNAGRVFFGSANKYIQGTNTALTVGKWYDFELLLNFGATQTKGTLFIDGVSFIANQTLSIKDISFLRLESSRNAGTTATNADGSSVVADIKIDDIIINSIGDLEVVSMVPTEDDNLATAKITFSNDVDSATISPADFVVNGGDVAVSSVAPLNGSKREWVVTFASPLLIETEYDVLVKGISDSYGNPLDDTQLVYKTRDKKFNVGSLSFYKDYDTPDEEEQFFLSNETITAAFDVVNEKDEPYDAVLIMAHKRNGDLVAAVAKDASVDGGGSGDRYISLPVSGVTENDTLEVYIWDSLLGMKPIADGKILTTAGVESIELTEELKISSLTVNADISADTAESAVMSISGDVSPEQNGIVTACVLKPGFTDENLTFDNFPSAVDFIKQGVSNEDGSYTFTYNMAGAVNASVYNVYVGGYAVTPKEEYHKEITFFGNDFVQSVIIQLNNASAEDISKMLAEDIYVPNITPNVYLNTVLNLDLTDYSLLNDYTEKESYKSAVAKAMEPITFTDKEHVNTEFNTIVAQQKTNQQKYLRLLNDINISLWSNLAQRLQENDDMLQLNWEGSYSKIKNDKDLLESFYKKLEDIPFDDFDDIRSSFEAEAESLVPKKTPVSSGREPQESDKDSVKYSPDLAQKNTAEPLTPKTEKKDPVTFNDIDGVAWAKEAITYLAEHEIVNGVAKGSFAPNDFVTREQFVKMVILAMGLHNEEKVTEQFVDAGKREWYNSYIANAVEHGIVHGVDDTHFGIGLEITRAEMAAIIYRAAAAAGKTLASGEGYAVYADDASIPDYARECVMALGEAGIMNGVGNGLFAPREKATRAMAAKVIYLLMGVK